jgi:hypothetical protein
VTGCPPGRGAAQGPGSGVIDDRGARGAATRAGAATQAGVATRPRPGCGSSTAAFPGYAVTPLVPLPGLIGGVPLAALRDLRVSGTVVLPVTEGRAANAHQ